MEIRLDGKVAVITGGGGGFGQAFSTAFAQAGAIVCPVDVNLSLAESVAASLRDSGSRAQAYQLDVTNSAAIERTFNQVSQQFGGVDILINIAGDNSRFPLMDLPEQEWDRLMDLNLKSVFLCCKAVLPHLMRRGGGRIINMASHIAIPGRALQSHYAASKAGIIALTSSLAQEMVPHRITVNGFAPGSTESPMWIRGLTPVELEDRKRSGRVGQPGDLAPVAVFLASEYGYHVTGHIVARDHYMPR